MTAFGARDIIASAVWERRDYLGSPGTIDTVVVSPFLGFNIDHDRAFI